MEPISEKDKHRETDMAGWRMYDAEKVITERLLAENARLREELARAIEAAALPEGWVAVPKEPTLAMLGCLRADITSNLEKRYQAMLAAAPKPTQAEKQEPVKDAVLGNAEVNGGRLADRPSEAV